MDEPMWRIETTSPSKDRRLNTAIERAGQIWQAATKPGPGIQIELWALLNWLVDERKLWREKHREIKRSIQAEGQDPAGTIWEHAAKLQEEILALNKKLQEQSHAQNPLVH